MKKLVCFFLHRKFWKKKRYLGYTDHNTYVKCKKCGEEFTF